MFYLSKINLSKIIKLLIGLDLEFGKEWEEGRRNGGRRGQIAIYLHSDMGVIIGVTLILLDF